MVAEEFELYLIRHGLAAERGEHYPDDTKRPLTSRGIQKLRREAKALNALDVSFDVMLTSPLVRARQTAEALASGLRVPPPVINAPSLAPGGTHNAIVDELAKQSHRRKRMAVVGHEPGIGELAARLLGLRKPVEFKKGGICRIDVTALPPTGPGQLRWLLTPRMLRKIGD
jgi:phosphohistidine phosphatase